MEKEEKELRELLPKSALLHNCLVLHLAEGVFLYLILVFACCVSSSVNICADSQLQYNHPRIWQWHSYICLENGGWCLETRRKTGRSSFCYACPCCFTTAAQDGVERDFWKFDGLLVCHDKSELNLDKIIVFNNKDKDKSKLLYFENLPTDADSKNDDGKDWKGVRTFCIKNACKFLFLQLVARTKSSATSPVGCPRIYPRYFSGFENSGAMGFHLIFFWRNCCLSLARLSTGKPLATSILCRHP